MIDVLSFKLYIYTHTYISSLNLYISSLWSFSISFSSRVCIGSHHCLFGTTFDFFQIQALGLLWGPIWRTSSYRRVGWILWNWSYEGKTCIVFLLLLLLLCENFIFIFLYENMGQLIQIYTMCFFSQHETDKPLSKSFMGIGSKLGIIYCDWKFNKSIFPLTFMLFLEV